PARAERAECQSQRGHQAVHQAGETLARRAGEVNDPRAELPKRRTRSQALQHPRQVEPPTPSARAKTTMLAASRATPASRTGLRPMKSDRPPTVSNVRSRASAETPKREVNVMAEESHRAR